MAIDPITWEEQLINVDRDKFTTDPNLAASQEELAATWDAFSTQDTSWDATVIDEAKEDFAALGADLFAEEPKDDTIVGKPTPGDAVFDWTTPVSTWAEWNIFDWLDLWSVTDEISRGTDLWNKLAKEIQIRRWVEWTTGKQDSVLAGIGFSTIDDPKDDATQEIISSEAAQRIAAEILKPGWEFEALGLANVSALDDTRVRSFFESQGYPKGQIDAIIQARDTQLKSERIRDEGANIVERETQRINEEIDREEARIQEQVDKNLNIAQRQRSLRGVWLSSATEGDLRDIQEKGNELMSAYRAKKNTELALFEARQNNADAETIAWLQETLQNQVNTQNLLIKENADIESRLVAQGKLDSQAAFDSLMSNLDLAWVDKEWVDQETSELVWYLSDKFWNAILIDGEQFPVGWTTSAQAGQVTAFVDWIINGDLSSAASVPTELRWQVLAALAKKREAMWTLSFEDQAQASALSKKHFWNTKDENVAAIEWMLLEGKSPSEVTQILENAWFSEAYTGTMRDIFWNIAWGLTESARDFAVSEFNRRLEGGNEKSAIQTLLSVAKETESTTTQQQIQGRIDLLNNVEALWKALDDYTKAGWDTGKIPGTFEKITQLAGSTTDPKLATILNEIALTVQAYRKSQTGAAFSESEAKEYQAIFPNISDSLLLNATKIASLQNLFSRNTENFYRQKFGAAEYDEVFPNWVLPILLPGSSFDPGETFDFSKITPDMSDEDIIKAFQSWWVWTSSWGWAADFDINDDNAVNDFLSFNLGDQTSSSKDPLSFIKSKEGFRSEAYQDVAWVRTIGYWATKVDGKPVQSGDTITKQQGDKIFQEDIARHSNFKNLVTVKLTPEQQTALASFEFNLGPNIWKTTWKSIIDDINAWNIESAVKTLLAHNKAKDPDTKELKVIQWLTNRRESEAKLLKLIS